MLFFTISSHIACYFSVILIVGAGRKMTVAVDAPYNPNDNEEQQLAHLAYGQI